MQDPQNEQVEQEVDDLDAAIMAELEKAETAEDAGEESPAESEVETEAEPEESDEVEEVSAEAEESEEEEAEEAEEPEPLEARHHWKTSDKALFAEMPRKIQERWLEREDEFQQGMVKKGEEVAQFRQFNESVQAAVQPYIQNWQVKGIDPYTGLQRALAIAGKLDADPQSALVELSRERGVNLEQAVQDAPYVDPQVAELQRQIQELSEQQHTVQQSQTFAQQQAIEQALRDFEDATDADGNLKHPHFRKLFEPMGIFIKTGRAKGLDDAYELAMRYDPEIQDELAKQTKVASIEKKNKAAKRAKAASKTTNSEENKAEGKTQSLDDDILEQLEAQGVQ